MKKVLLLTTLCLPLLFGGCAKRIVDMTVTIYGIVVDAETDTPIEGVLVTLSPGVKNKYTENDGYFEFSDMIQQQYTLNAMKDGYKTDRKSINANPGETVEIIFSLHRE